MNGYFLLFQKLLMISSFFLILIFLVQYFRLLVNISELFKAYLSEYFDSF